MKFTKKAFTSLFLLGCFSCASLPKETVKQLQSTPRKHIELPVDYANSFPTLTFEQWDKDYSKYNKFLTKDVLKTQMGMSFVNNGVKTWMVSNSARPHIQLDTLTRITDKNKVLGKWRAVINRKIRFTDSASFDSKTITRNSEVFYNEKDADVFLNITPEKILLGGTETGSNKYKKVAEKNYEIQNGRYLLMFGSSKAAAHVSLIGLDGENLIYNQYSVIEDKFEGKYIVYKTILTQLVLQKI